MNDFSEAVNAQGKRVLRTNRKAEGATFGDYVSLCNEHAHLIDAEVIYREVWGQAKRLCEKAQADPIGIEMIIRLMRCNDKICKEEKLPYLDMGDDIPVMTIGWKIHLTDEEVARLTKEDIASIAGGIFAEGE